MNYYLDNLKWIINAFALDVEKLPDLFPENSCIPIEMLDQYEMIVDYELNQIRPVLTSEQLSQFKLVNEYMYKMIMREDLANSWYDNNFVYSEEWRGMQAVARDFEAYMAWEIHEPLSPLYSEIYVINQPVGATPLLNKLKKLKPKHLLFLFCLAGFLYFLIIS